MIAIIPVAGIGTQLRPHTYSQPKSLIPVAGKPILGYIIEQLIEVEIKEFVFVIGYLGEKIKEYVDLNFPEINKKYVVQESREGLGQAIWLTKDTIPKDREIIIVLGDTIIDADLKTFIKLKNSALAVKRVDDPRLFGVAQINENNQIIQVAEKPKIPKSNMALVGLYKIKEYQLLINILENNIKHKIKTNNEYLLTEGLQKMIEKYQVTFEAFKVDNWYDCGQKEVLLKTNALLLKQKKKITKLSKKITNTIIVEPVVIGKNTVIENSIIGPNATIGDNSIIQDSIIKDSIIGTYTNLKGIMLHHSLIGNDTEIKGASQSLNIGDNTALDLR
jgi:glucose-1-phosphate thymidylyltransferase